VLSQSITTGALLWLEDCDERDRQRTTYSDLSGHVLPAHGPFASVCYQAGPGRPFLSAAAASARRGDSREAHAALKAATVCSAELGQDRSDLATVFGPTNVAIHQVATSIELGDAQAAGCYSPYPCGTVRPDAEAAHRTTSPIPD
jgi:hypothetical protein